MKKSKSKILEDIRNIINKLHSFQYSNVEEKERLEEKYGLLMQKLRKLKSNEVKTQKESNKIKYRANTYNKFEKKSFKVIKEEFKPIEEPIPPEEPNNSFKDEIEIIEPTPLDPASFNALRRYLIINGNRTTLKEYIKVIDMTKKQVRKLFEKWVDLDFLQYRRLSHNEYEYYIEGLLTK